MSDPSVAPAVTLAAADPGFRADPYPALRALRLQAPVQWLPSANAWAITGYEHVRALLRDPRTSTGKPRAAPGLGLSADHRLERLQAESHDLFARFLHVRPPDEHLHLRRLAMPAFTPRRVAARRARIQSFTDTVLDRALAEGRLDVTEDLARPLALTIATEVLGVPGEMLPTFAKWSPELFGCLVLLGSPAGRARGLLAMRALSSQLRELLASWRTSPPPEDNLLWSLDRARAEGLISETDVLAHGAILASIGSVTTRHAIGNGVLALLRHRDQWDLLCARPDLIETAVDELLRYDGPVPMVGRAAREDMVVAGQTVQAGQALILFLAAAHRDPAVFPDPDRLDITRSPNPHLGLGHDAHYCVGAALARLEMQVAIGELARRAPRARLATESLEWEETFDVRGVRSLPLLLT